MTWTETDSLSFTARHDDADLACAHRVLDALEDLRLRLEDRFDEVPGNVTIIPPAHPAWPPPPHPPPHDPPGSPPPPPRAPPGRGGSGGAGAAPLSGGLADGGRDPHPERLLDGA